MNGDGRAPADTFTAIPILLDPVIEPALQPVAPAPADDTSAARAGPTTPASRRPLGQEDQQPLFDDLPPVSPAAARRHPATPPLLRLAERMLRERAPAIIEDVVAAHAADLDARLRHRLHDEFSRLLAELAGADENPGA